MTRECWLVSDGNVLASAERAETRRERTRGLLGRSGVEGALVLPRTAWVHTFGMRFDIDVAHLDRSGNVLRTTHMHRNRLGVPVRGADSVVEAEAGSFERWGLQVGMHIEVRE